MTAPATDPRLEPFIQLMATFVAEQVRHDLAHQSPENERDVHDVVEGG